MATTSLRFKTCNPGFSMLYQQVGTILSHILKIWNITLISNFSGSIKLDDSPSKYPSTLSILPPPGEFLINFPVYITIIL